MLDNIFDSDNILDSVMELPEDSSQWTQKISEILFSIHPQLAQVPSKFTLDKFEPIKLYAKGSYIFNLNGHKLIIPILVKAKKLQPLDVGILDKRWRYLAPDVVTEFLNGITLGETANNYSGFYEDVDPIRGTKVPYETVTTLNSGVEFGDGGRYITASEIMTQGSKQDLLIKLSRDKSIMSNLSKNLKAKNVFMKTLQNDPTKTACVAYCFLRHNRDSVKLTTKTASGEITEQLCQLKDIKPLIEKIAGKDGYTTLLETGYLSKVEKKAAIPLDLIENVLGGVSPLKHIMSHLNEMFSGGKLPVLNTLKDGDIHPTKIVVIKLKGIGPLSSDRVGGLFNDGSFKVLEDNDAAGCPEESDQDVTESSWADDKDNVTKGDTIVPLISKNEGIEPIVVDDIHELPVAKVIKGHTEEGDNPFIGVILKPLDCKLASQADSLNLYNRKDMTVLPHNVKFLKVNKKAKLAHAQITKFASINTFKKDSKKYTLRKLSGHSYALNDKIYASKYHLKQAMAMLQISDDMSEFIIKKASDNRKTDFLVEEHKSNKEKIAAIKNAYDWVKLASTLDETEESIDSVLSLGMLDSDGDYTDTKLHTIVSAAESELAKLLVMSRLGATNLDEEAILNALKALQKVEESLT